MKTRRTNQGGSIVTFVIIGVILVVVLISALYLVNIRGQQARKNQEIATSETQKTGTAQSGSSSSTKQKSNSADSEASAPTTSNEESASRAPLPTTGIETDLGQLTGVYLLTAFSTAYILSRRKPVHSL